MLQTDSWQFKPKDFGCLKSCLICVKLQEDHINTLLISSTLRLWYINCPHVLIPCIGPLDWNWSCVAGTSVNFRFPLFSARPETVEPVASLGPACHSTSDRTPLPSILQHSNPDKSRRYGDSIKLTSDRLKVSRSVPHSWPLLGEFYLSSKQYFDT